MSNKWILYGVVALVAWYFLVKKGKGTFLGISPNDGLGPQVKSAPNVTAVTFK